MTPHAQQSERLTEISEIQGESLNRAKQPLAIAIWLLSVAFAVFCVVIVGGITRLTESGLSITEWNVVTGILPPLNHEQWQAEFALYQRTTEYQTVNQGMDLAAFKMIYFWEYLHRLIARSIGLIFIVPYLWFLLRRAIPAGYGWRLLVLLLLGAMQGVIGWWMVVSGLSGRTDVSHYRLAIHLLNALLIMSALIWTALDLLRRYRRGLAPARAPSGLALVALAALAVQLLYGAWLAGLNAGYVASDWPLMQGQFFPAGIDWSAGLATFADDPFLVHFIHRSWAWLAAGLLVFVALRISHEAPIVAALLLMAIVVQVALGIATVMSGINIVLATSHQAMGCILLALAVTAAHRCSSVTAR